MAYLVDTNILARLANSADSSHGVAARAVIELHYRGEMLHIVPQNLVEFRSLATRPAASNGLNLTSLDAAARAAVFESIFPLLTETPDLFPAWKALVEAEAVVGKQVHDARLVAACHVHRVSHLLTFNVTHFARLAKFGPGLVVVAPGSV